MTTTGPTRPCAATSGIGPVSQLPHLDLLSTQGKAPWSFATVVVPNSILKRQHCRAMCGANIRRATSCLLVS